MDSDVSRTLASSHESYRLQGCAPPKSKKIMWSVGCYKQATPTEFGEAHKQPSIADLKVEISKAKCCIRLLSEIWMKLRKELESSFG